MTKRFLPLLFVLAVLFIASCKKENELLNPSEPSRNYYPLTRGHYVIYDVDSTIWNDFDGSKTLRHSQMSYTVSDTFTDNEQRKSYQVDVLVRNSDTSQWRTSDVFYVTPTLTGLDVVQNNLRFLKMVYPVANGTTWKGNSQIAVNDQDLSFYADWNYKYSKVGESYNNSRVNFDNTVIVDEVDASLNDPETTPNSYAERTYSREVYAYNIGLVYREYVRWVYDQNASGVYARKGYGVTMRAVDHN